MSRPRLTSGDPPARILIVDDHALVRHGLTELITHESELEVCGCADDMNDALKGIEETSPNLVIVDISLKSSNGIELVKQINSRFPTVKVLVSSMHDESLFAERALQAGALGYVSKQESTDTLIEAINRVMDGHIYLSAAMNDQLLHRITRGSDEDSSIERLSDRELEVFELIGNGQGTRQIAGRLSLSIKTIETYRENIKEKLGLKNSAELTRHAVQWVLEGN